MKVRKCNQCKQKFENGKAYHAHLDNVSIECRRQSAASKAHCRDAGRRAVPYRKVLAAHAQPAL